MEITDPRAKRIRSNQGESIGFESDLDRVARSGIECREVTPSGYRTGTG